MGNSKDIGKWKNPLGQQLVDLETLFVEDKNNNLYKAIVSLVEKPLIESILEKTGGNQIRAAGLLGINRNTLHTKIKKLGIKVVRNKK